MPSHTNYLSAVLLAVTITSAASAQRFVHPETSGIPSSYRQEVISSPADAVPMASYETGPMASYETGLYESGYYDSGPSESCTLCGDSISCCGCIGAGGYGGSRQRPSLSSSFGSLGGLGCLNGNSMGQVFVGGEFLYVRANPSEALAFIETNFVDPAMPFQRFHDLDFQHGKSYSYYFGYRLPHCCEEIRFTFTRYSSSGFAVTPEEEPGIDITVPLEPDPDGDFTFIEGDVNLKDYDLGISRTIALGSPLCDDCGCGDVCDGACGCWCPAWDITWTGALRYADVGWAQSFLTYEDPDTLLTTAGTTMSFEGGGARMGLEGRRYFGRRGLVSVYLKGDISLLMGNVDLVTERETDDTPGQIIRQFSNKRIIVPVTEIEAGITAQVNCNTQVSAGYFLSAWHDLGFRQNWDSLSNFGLTYDDANILGFDGLSVRVETAF